MKALVYTGPETLELGDVPDPVPGSEDATVRIARVGICGSDMHAYLGHDDRRPAPLVLGREAAGVVEGWPDDGRRVTINPLVTCGACKACRSGRDNVCADRQIISMPPREGAFAERVAIPRGNLGEVPADVPMEKAALAEPLACGAPRPGRPRRGPAERPGARRRRHRPGRRARGEGAGRRRHQDRRATCRTARHAGAFRNGCRPAGSPWPGGLLGTRD